MRSSNKGFTLAEVCLVIMMLSVFMMLCTPVSEVSLSSIYRFPDEYLLKQSEALCRRKQTVYEDDAGNTVIFNRSGNVRSARTLNFGKRKIVIELGGGRLVFR